jgi:hypothetical protein
MSAVFLVTFVVSCRIRISTFAYCLNSAAKCVVRAAAKLRFWLESIIRCFFVSLLVHALGLRIVASCRIVSHRIVSYCIVSATDSRAVCQRLEHATAAACRYGQCMHVCVCVCVCGNWERSF